MSYLCMSYLCTSIFSPSFLQGGLIATLVAFESQDLFVGMVLSAAAVEVDPQSAGTFIVSDDPLPLHYCI